MSDTLKICLICILTMICGLSSDAQTVSNANGRSVEWLPLGGYKNEFSVHIPADYIITGDANFYLKPNRGAQVVKKVVAARYINGVVLWMEYYEGDVKDIQPILIERAKMNFEGEETVSNFQIKRFSGKAKNSFIKAQYFSTKNRLYIIKTIESTENTQIGRTFLESVRLFSNNTAVAPNAAPGATTISLPKLIENSDQSGDSAQVFSEKEADRQILILFSPRAKVSPEDRKDIGSAAVKLKVLFASSGKVANVEVLESSSKIFEKEAIEAVKKTVFIPAEKDGKLVSVYKTIEQNFRTN